MTYNKIKKALDEAELFLRNRVRDGQPIKLSEDDVGILRNISQVCAKAYDEIDQLQTENESLKVENQSLRGAANSLKMHYEEAQTEVERLQNILICFMDALGKVRKVDDIDEISLIPLMSELNKQYRAELKAEAYKEFAERVKEFMHNKFKALDEYEFEYITERDINNFVKEMVGENND